MLYNFNIDEYKDRRKQSRKTVRGESNYSVPCDSKRSLAQKRVNENFCFFLCCRHLKKEKAQNLLM